MPHVGSELTLCSFLKSVAVSVIFLNRTECSFMNRPKISDDFLDFRENGNAHTYTCSTECVLTLYLPEDDAQHGNHGRGRRNYLWNQQIFYLTLIMSV
jgi:hypothetical protein